MERKSYRINKDVNTFLFATIGEYLKRRYGLTTDTRSVLDETAAPYLILAHHVSSFDAFFISAVIGKPVQYLASDAIFRNPLMKFLLSLVGAIPKAKFRSDRNVIRNLLEIRDRGGIVGVFPEGQSSWDGANQPFLLSTGKLVKLLKIPVVSAKIHGAYHIRPRWSRSKREGRVEVEFSNLLSKEEAAALSVSEINEKIAASLVYNAWDRQRMANRGFSGPAPAERLEKVLFLCPECASVGTLRSKGAWLACASCGFSVAVNDRGFFESGGRPSARGEADAFRFTDLREWNLWQTGQFKAMLDEGLERTDSRGEKGQTEAQPPLLADSGILLKTGDRSKALRRAGKGALSLTCEGLAFTRSGTSVRFELKDLQGLNIQPKEHMEFFYRGALWRFEFPVNVSAYKWFIALNHARHRLGCAEKGIFYGDALATGL